MGIIRYLPYFYPEGPDIYWNSFFYATLPVIIYKIVFLTHLKLLQYINYINKQKQDKKIFAAKRQRCPRNKISGKVPFLSFFLGHLHAENSNLASAIRLQDKDQREKNGQNNIGHRIWFQLLL